MDIPALETFFVTLLGSFEDGFRAVEFGNVAPGSG